MVFQNHFLNQDKSVQKLQKCRTWLCLPGTLYLNMVCFTCDIYFGYFKKTVKKLIYLLLLTICKYFTICTCSKPMNLSLSVLKALFWLVMYCPSNMSLQSPDFLPFIQQLLVLIFMQLLTFGGPLLFCTCFFCAWPISHASSK